MIDMIEAVNNWINGIVWGVPVLMLILLTGFYYTARLGFIQFLHPVKLVKETVVKAFQKNLRIVCAIVPTEICHCEGALRPWQSAPLTVGRGLVSSVTLYTPV